MSATNLGAVPEFIPSPGNEVVYVGERYHLYRIVMHSPAEHRFDAETFDMEIHLYHRSDNGNRLNVAVMANEGSAHPDLSRLISALGNKGQPSVSVSGVDLRTLVPRLKNYFVYTGSETIPPCDEGIVWVVMKRPILVAPNLINRLQFLYGKNSRPLSPVNGRMILAN